MPLMDTDQTAAGKRFEPTAPRNRKAKRGAVRKYQSLWNVSQFSEQQSQGVPEVVETTIQTEIVGSTTTTAIVANFNKRLPKWLRWGGGKKTSAETKTDRGPNKSDLGFPYPMGSEQHRFLGNLGIGGFIEAEGSTFVTADEIDESSLPVVTGATKAKSLMNLSSLLLWPSEDATAIGVKSATPGTTPVMGRTNKRNSLSTSSRRDSFIEGSPSSQNSTSAHENPRSRGLLPETRNPLFDHYCAIPELIKVLFLTNTPLGRELMDVDTLRLTTTEGARKPLEFVKSVMPLPAWFIHENSPLIPNMTYWVSSPSVKI
ncbi:hypothetical protein FBUS_06571 [Fasciolopsis buskii]|uniref:Uncharacterized protein n=1 Tax=Fasciolopsis buskii TaxID=27845 RepID=A0A8E0VP36_9TREM|nr:hypothetical protein FBUS_06571 [Fasciolopsis buski]